MLKCHERHHIEADPALAGLSEEGKLSLKQQILRRRKRQVYLKQILSSLISQIKTFDVQMSIVWDRWRR